MVRPAPGGSRSRSLNISSCFLSHFLSFLFLSPFIHQEAFHFLIYFMSLIVVCFSPVNLCLSFSPNFLSLFILFSLNLTLYHFLFFLPFFYSDPFTLKCFHSLHFSCSLLLHYGSCLSCYFILKSITVVSFQAIVSNVYAFHHLPF